MALIHELLGYKHIKIFQDEEKFRFSLDSTLLADFVKIKKSTKKIIDLGTGNAPIPLFLTLKTDANIIGVEIQKEVYELAQKSIDINNLNDQIKILNNDIKDIYKEVGANTFDIVTSNPPYFKYLPTSNINKNDFLTIARHEILITLEDIVVEAKKLLQDGGYLYIVHRVARFSELVLILNKHNFGIKRIKFVYSKTTADNALIVLVEARQNKKDDTVVEKPLYIYDDNGQYTKEVMQIFNFKKEDISKNI
jgi:tRNA1(Val) A37 N6-methylase TrmN6